MSDTLTISGSTTVVTDELLEHATQLGGLSDRSEGWASRLHSLARDNAAEWVAEPASIAHLDEAGHQATRLADEGERLRAALILAAGAYGHAERSVAGLWGVGAQIGAWLMGATLPVAVLLATPAAAAAALTAARLGAMLGLPPQKVAALLQEWVKSNPSLLNSPAFVNAVRLLGSHSDEFVMGLAGVPLAITLGVGSQIGAEQNAATITALGTILGIAAGKRILAETPQKVTQVHRPGQGVGETTVAPPRNVADLASRVMSSEPGDPQILVERYGPDDAPRWVVYITGTIDFGLTPGTETLDFTSNMHAAADGSAASEQAVRDALQAAGADVSDELMLVGHSQGGLLAARLAESGDLNVSAFVSMGGPLGAVSTGDVPGLSIEHTDDMVPAVTGAGEPQPGLTTVGRTVLDDLDAAAIAAGKPPAEPFAGHALEQYVYTAQLVSASQDEQMQGWDKRVKDFAGKGPGVETLWHSERVVPTAP